MANVPPTSRIMMIIIAMILIVLGAVSIWYGFDHEYPNASSCGAIFFVGGFLLLGLERIVWHLAGILKALSDKPKSE